MYYLDSTLHLPNFAKCMQLEHEGIKLADKERFEESLELFFKAIQICSENPSPYNNRAQVYRLLKNTEGFFTLIYFYN